MKEELDRHQDRLSPAERRKLWDRIRPDAARARRETTVRRWSFSFGLAVTVVAIAAILITERREEKVRRERDRDRIVEVVPLRPNAISPGPAANGQIGVSPRAPNDRFVYRAPGLVRRFTEAASESISTFAFDLDGSGYTVARAFVDRGTWPPADIVRVEDFVNAFDQGYPDVADADFRIFVDGAPSSFGEDCRLVRVGLKARGGAADSGVVVARNAKVRVSFDPRAVVEYRLLGFDTRVRSSDGHPNGYPDSHPDGRTILAGHEVTALYEVRLAKHRDLGRILDVRVDYATPDGEQAPAVAAQLGAPDLHPVFATAPARLRLDAAVAEFAEILKGYPWTTSHRIGDVMPTIRQLAAELRTDPRVVEFASFAERTAALETAGGRPAIGAQ